MKDFSLPVAETTYDASYVNFIHYRDDSSSTCRKKLIESRTTSQDCYTLSEFYYEIDLMTQSHMPKRRNLITTIWLAISFRAQADFWLDSLPNPIMHYAEKLIVEYCSVFYNYRSVVVSVRY
jgi:hypothetical protein